MVRSLRAGILLLAFVGFFAATTGCSRKSEEMASVSDLIPGDTTGLAGGDTALGGGPSGADGAQGTTPGNTARADHIEVQHVLIGYVGSVPGKDITRTREEARTLAHQILARARRGENFDALVNEYTDDQAPGIYRLANDGVTPGEGEYARTGMVKGFSDVAFSLSTGNVGIAEYDPQASPYGWHIIKRVR